MIQMFNCTEQLRVTLAGVPAQDPGPEQMQIEVVDALRSRAREVAASTALRRARRAIDTGRPQVARAQVRAAIGASRSPAVVLGIAHTALRFAIRARRSRARA